jgi:hypothetical protein
MVIELGINSHFEKFFVTVFIRQSNREMISFEFSLPP